MLQDSDFVEVGLTRVQQRRLQSAIRSGAFIESAAAQGGSQDPPVELPQKKQRRVVYSDAVPRQVTEALPENPTDAVKAAAKGWAKEAGVDIASFRSAYKDEEGATWLAKCTCRTSCQKGAGTRYRFKGRRADSCYTLTVGTAGICGGDLALVRNTTSRKPLTKKQASKVNGAIKSLLAQNLRPTPFLVQAQISETVPVRSVRNLVRKLSKKPGGFWTRAGKRRRGRLGRKPISWTAHLVRFSDSRQNPDCGYLCFTQRVLGPIVHSFVMLAPRFFQELQKLCDDGIITGGLVVGSDATDIGCQGYIFTEVFLQLYRKLSGRWRKTGWPIAVACHPREDKTAYGAVLGDTNSELRRRGLPLVKQAHFDWFKGLESECAKVGITKNVQGIWHMNRNLRRNQSHPEQGTPHMLNDKVDSVIQRIHDQSTLPTKTMFHVHWSVQRQRMRDLWHEGAWTDQYLFKQYFQEAKLTQAKAAEYGAPELITASWHYGVQSDSLRGHGPFQQLPEQGHSNAKRNLPITGNLDEELLVNYEKLMRNWTRPPSSEEKDFTLLADPENISMAPTSPDEWMLTQGLVAKPPGRKSVFLPSIAAIVDAAQTPGQPIGQPMCVQRIHVSGRLALVMRVGVPRPIERTFAEALVKQFRTKDIATLHADWRRMNIIQTVDGHEKVLNDKLHEFWGLHCVVLLGGGMESTGSCWYCCRHGHCNHVYAAEQLEGFACHVGIQVPDACEGAIVLRSGGHGVRYQGEATSPQADVVHLSRAVKDARAKAKRNKRVDILGGVAPGVSQSVHEAMVAMANEGALPVTTMTRRSSLQTSTAKTSVPHVFELAAKHFYLHPALPAPKGYKWHRRAHLEWDLRPSKVEATSEGTLCIR